MKLAFKLPRRNPDAPRLSLRERFAATREKYARTLKVHRALNQPPETAPADRIALVNYATWLHFERRRLCAELYPHMGRRAEDFVICISAADEFHFPFGGFGQSLVEAQEPPSARAVRILDLVGVDWRSDLTDSGRDHLDCDMRSDTGARPAPPYGWPALDAELVSAISDLRRLDATLGDFAKGLPEDRSPETVPGYLELEEARSNVFSTLWATRAEGLPGLQAKAKAILSEGVLGNLDQTADLAHSLAKNLLGIRDAARIEPQPDPIFAVIEEQRRLYREHDAAYQVCGSEPDTHPAWKPEKDAHAAMWEHWRSVVLKTRPRTAEGCRAFAAYALEFLKEQGTDLDEEGPIVLDLIARSPLL